MNAKLTFLIKGIIFLLIGLYLSSLGVPSSEDDAKLMALGELNQELNKSLTSPEAKNIIANNAELINLFSVLFTWVGIAEILFSLASLMKS